MAADGENHPSAAPACGTARCPADMESHPVRTNRTGRTAGRPRATPTRSPSARRVRRALGRHPDHGRLRRGQRRQGHAGGGSGPGGGLREGHPPAPHQLRPPPLHHVDRGPRTGREPLTATVAERPRHPLADTALRLRRHRRAVRRYEVDPQLRCRRPGPPADRRSRQGRRLRPRRRHRPRPSPPSCAGSPPSSCAPTYASRITATGTARPPPSRPYSRAAPPSSSTTTDCPGSAAPAETRCARP